MLLRKDPSTLHLWNGFVSFVSFRCVADITCSHTDRISQFRCAEKMPLLHHPINLSASSVRPTYSALLKYNLVSGKTAHLIRWWDRTSSTAKINHFELPFNTSPSKHCFFLVLAFRVEHISCWTHFVLNTKPFVQIMDPCGLIATSCCTDWQRRPCYRPVPVSPIPYALPKFQSAVARTSPYCCAANSRHCSLGNEPFGTPVLAAVAKASRRSFPVIVRNSVHLKSPSAPYSVPQAESRKRFSSAVVAVTFDTALHWADCSPRGRVRVLHLGMDHQRPRHLFFSYLLAGYSAALLGFAWALRLSRNVPGFCLGNCTGFLLRYIWRWLSGRWRCSRSVISETNKIFYSFHSVYVNNNQQMCILLSDQIWLYWFFFS